MTEQTVEERIAELEAIAGEQAYRAERAELMAKFGLSAEELEGDFASAREMQQHAELASLRKQAAAGPVTPVAPVVEEPPPVGDAGGPTAFARPAAPYQEIDAEYERVKAMGPGQQARRLMLQNIYRDRRRTSPIRPEHE